jgi:hypothetical protein
MQQQYRGIKQAAAQHHNAGVQQTQAPNCQHYHWHAPSHSYS